MVQSVEEKSLLLQSSGDNDVGTDVAAFIAIDEADDNKKTLRTTKCKSYDDLASSVYTDMDLCKKTFSKSTNFILSSVKSSAHISLENSQDDVFRPQTEHNTAGRHIVINEDSDPASASGTVVVKFQHARGYVFPEHHECQHYFQTCEESMVNLIDAEYYDSTWNNEIGNLIQNHIGPCRVIYPQRSYETSQSSESVICRICHSYGDDRLIAPCKCDGSTRYVHATCLVTWFKKSVKNQCELCKSDVKIRKINHNITVWRKPEDRPIPLIWFSVFFIGLFLNVLSIYVNASESCKSTACLIFYVVNGFGIILDAAFLWFWFHKCRYYWQKWCALNQDWYIDDLDDTNDVHVEYVKNQRGQIV